MPVAVLLDCSELELGRRLGRAGRAGSRLVCTALLLCYTDSRADSSSQAAVTRRLQVYREQVSHYATFFNRITEKYKGGG